MPGLAAICFAGIGMETFGFTENADSGIIGVTAVVKGAMSLGVVTIFLYFMSFSISFPASDRTSLRPFCRAEFKSVFSVSSESIDMPWSLSI